MLLAVDIGNTETSLGIFDGPVLRYHFRTQTSTTRVVDEYAAFLFPLLQHHGIQPECFTGIVFASVVPATQLAFEEFSNRYFGKPPVGVGPEMNLPFRLNVKVPLEVGADRIANVAFAVKRLRLPSVVIDFGTATTLDLVSSSGNYEGGVIMPGAALSVEALGLRTSKLPFVELRFPKEVVGKNTVECIQSGVLYGYCDGIRGLVGRIENEVGQKCSIALTGGLGYLFEEKLGLQCQYLPNLTLEGIYLLYEFEKR